MTKINVAAIYNILASAGIPILGVSNPDDILAHVVIQFADTATPAQIAAANNALATFVDPDIAKAQTLATQTASAKAAVNGTAALALTPAQLRLIVLILAAQQGWIDINGNMAIP